MDYKYTKIWKIDYKFVVADTIEEAITLYKEATGLYKTYQSTDIKNIQAIGNGEVLREDFDALIKKSKL